MSGIRRFPMSQRAIAPFIFASEDCNQPLPMQRSDSAILVNPAESCGQFLDD